MSAVEPAPGSETPPASKRRHPVEFWLVRIGIAVLVVCVGIQAHARFGYEQTLRRLQNKLSTDEHEAGGLKVADVPQCIVGWPQHHINEDRHWKQVVYSWQGLTDSYEIRMAYDSTEDPAYILALITADAPEEPELPPPSEEEAASVSDAVHGGGMGPGGMPSVGPGGPGGPGGGGPGGGGPRPDLMSNDKDGDGKISREEAPERMAQFFDRMDANSDGFIDAEEIAEARRRREASGGGRGGPPGAHQQQRPAAEESTEPAAEAPADALQPNGQ